MVMAIDDPLRLAYVLATLIDMTPKDKQALLEENELVAKLQAVDDALTRESRCWSSRARSNLRHSRR